jgi:hypothetical protein
MLCLIPQTQVFSLRARIVIRNDCSTSNCRVLSKLASYENLAVLDLDVNLLSRLLGKDVRLFMSIQKCLVVKLTGQFWRESYRC